MNSEFKDKEYLPIWCEKCDRQGFVFTDNFEGNLFVICKACGGQYSDVWCDSCEMGGDFIKNLSEHPKSWNCPDCKKEHFLPKDFYDSPNKLYMEEDIPEGIIDQKAFGQTKSLNVKLILVGLIVFLLVLGLYLAAR